MFSVFWQVSFNISIINFSQISPFNNKVRYHTCRDWGILHFFQYTFPMDLLPYINAPLYKILWFKAPNYFIAFKNILKDISKLIRTFWQKCFNARYTQPLYHHCIIYVEDPQAELSHFQRQLQRNAAVFDNQFVEHEP